jgi:hypothetical protein
MIRWMKSCAAITCGKDDTHKIYISIYVDVLHVGLSPPEEDGE